MSDNEDNRERSVSRSRDRDEDDYDRDRRHNREETQMEGGAEENFNLHVSNMGSEVHLAV
jgi:hypothetical protein